MNFLSNMEENKYYIPSIDEFHVGFPYEVFNPEHEGDNTYSPIENASRLAIQSVITNWKHFSEYRVPYLSKEDIEAEGWKPWTEKSTHHFFKNDYSLYFYPNYETGEIDVKIMDTHEVVVNPATNGDTLFHGYIKNKSVFKQVLKMIGV